jgi:DeoR/GlpR family transcriptional regulator of sugar metabolism
LEWEVIEVKKAMIACAHKTVSLAISEKLNSVQRLRVCPLSDVDILITELTPESDNVHAYKQKGVEVL